MDSVLRTRLLHQNEWLRTPSSLADELSRRLPERFIGRHAKLTGLEDRSKAKLIVGPRQTGKSTLVWSLLEDIAPQELLYLDAEEPTVQAWSRSATQVLADLRAELPTVRTVFIDEAQRLPEAGTFVKGLIDAKRGLNVIVTGSSAFHLQARTRESLAGRAVRSLLLPFSLGELAAQEPTPLPLVVRERAARAYERQQLIGSYPAVWTRPDSERILSDLIEAFVIRDASDRFRIQRPDAFRGLLQLAAGQVGQMVNLSEWAGILGIAASTVREYLHLLEESWILKLLPAFAGGRRREITSAARVHFYDMGIRNMLLGAAGLDLARRPDRGALAEGWVFSELAKTLPQGWLLYYWRAKGGAEMDFVITRGERLIGVEVKAAGRAGLSRSTRSFIDAYTPECVVLAGGLDVEPTETRHGETVIRTIPLYEVAAVVEERLSNLP